MRGLWFLVVPAVVFTFYIGGLEKSRSHYLMIVYPYFAVVFGLFLARLLEFSEKKSVILPYVMAPFVLAPLFYFAVMSAYLFYNGDTRVDFYRWALKNFDSPFPVVYGDKSSEIVVKAFAKNRTRIPEGEVTIPEGYLYSQDENFPEQELRAKATVVNLLYEAEDKYKNGPKIKFYSYSL
jgi:hypothetical protein